MSDEREDLPPIGTAQNAADVARKAEMERVNRACAAMNAAEAAYAAIIELSTDLIEDRLKTWCRRNGWAYKIEWSEAEGLYYGEAHETPGPPLSKHEGVEAKKIGQFRDCLAWLTVYVEGYHARS